jgi:hypothetical protein
LDRNGKIQGAVESLVMTVLHIDPHVGASADAGELALAIATYFGIDLDVAVVKTAIESQLQVGRLVVDRSAAQPQIALSPEARADVATRIAEAAQLESQVRAEWLAQIDGFIAGAGADAFWHALQHYLGLVFRQHGVEAVQLLDAKASGTGAANALASSLDEAIQKAGLAGYEQYAKKAISSFFHDSSASRLRYMSELLDGTFTFFALTVGDSTAEYLKGQLPSLKLFLDTNVLLGMLGLQDNPLQAPCAELLATIESRHYPFQLYCHERTLREFNDIRDAAHSRLTAKRYPASLSAAYVQWAEMHGSAFGIEVHFHRLNATTELDVEAFLARFDHIEDLLTAKKVKIYRQSGPDLDVFTKGSFISEFEHYLKQHRPARPRRYEARDHDVMIWMYLQRLRSSSKNALRTGALLLSNDRALYSFDRSFLAHQPQAKEGATVVLPHQLLQVLRPLNPSTTNYDEQSLAVFAVPEFRTAQSGYDATVSKVMRYLASFDGVPAETAVLILNDDLLMGRLRDVDTQDQEFGQLVENAVLTENAALIEHMTSLQGALDQAEITLSNRTDEAQSRIEALTREAESVARQEQEARALVDAEATRRTQAEQDLAAERAKRREAEALAISAQAGQLKARRTLRLVAAILMAVVGSAVILGVPQWSGWTDFLGLKSHLSIQALCSLAWIGVSYSVAFAKNRNAVMLGVVAAAVIAALTLL